jgi:hypothetical protein
MARRAKEEARGHQRAYVSHLAGYREARLLARASFTVGRKLRNLEMEEYDGLQILGKVRARYKYGNKSPDKFYVPVVAKAYDRSIKAELAKELIQGGERKIVGYAAGTSLDMALSAAEEVTAAGSVAYIAVVHGKTNHFFCVADYPQGTATPAHVKDMSDWSCPAAGIADPWIIDPWMNISCRFQNYPGAVASKLAKWSNEGKRIQDERELKLHDPMSKMFLKLFFEIGLFDLWSKRDMEESLYAHRTIVNFS